VVVRLQVDHHSHLGHPSKVPPIPTRCRHLGCRDSRQAHKDLLDLLPSSYLLSPSAVTGYSRGRTPDGSYRNSGGPPCSYLRGCPWVVPDSYRPSKEA